MVRKRELLSCLPLIVACLVVAPAKLHAQIPIPAGFPNASNTGIAGVGLTVGDLTATSGRNITVAGTVIDMENISGTLNIKANNVTIRRSRIRTGGYYGVRIFSGYRGTVIEDCLMVGNAGSVNVSGSYCTIRRCDISGDHDGIKLSTGCLVEDSYIHDQLKEGGTHNDAMQDSGGSNGWVVRRNSIIGPYPQSTSAIIINTNFGPIDNILIEGNFISGGGYAVYCKDKGTGYGPPTNVMFRNNVWEKDSFTYNHITYDGNPTFECNTFHTGEPIPQNPPCNALPTADAGPDQTLTDTDGDGFEVVILDGSVSAPPPGETLTQHMWTDAGSLVGLDMITMTVLPVGVHTITLQVTASDGSKATDDVQITVEAGTQPGPGDADGDGDVDLEDFVIFKKNFGSTDATWSDGDFDDDGDVDIEDFVLLKKNFAA